MRPADPEAPALVPARARSRWRARNLPVALSSFIGREGDLAAIADAMAGTRLVTVCGPGGVGKSRVAIEFAQRRANYDAVTGPGDVWMVELAGVTSKSRVVDQEPVARAVLSALAGRTAARGQATADLVHHLHERPTLLVLDNCEHLVLECAKLVGQLSRSCPRLRVLTTSRQALGITGERVWWLQPLRVPGPAEVDLTALAANEAVRLFVERAADTSPGFVLTVEMAPAVAEICRLLDGLPLALELAAERTAVLSPSEILVRLEQPFQFLLGGSPDSAARQKGLHAAFEWGHDLLSAEEATLLRRLSAFVGGSSLVAAEEVCGGDGLDPELILDLLGSLVAKSFVVVDRGGVGTRYRMLGTARQFARAKLSEAGESEALDARHAGWCVARAAEIDAARSGPQREVWLAQLDADHDNFRAALCWARERDEIEIGLRLANSLSWFWETRGHLREGLAWLDESLSAGTDAPTTLQAAATRAAGRFTHMLGDAGSGEELVDRSVSLFRQTGEVAEAEGCVCHDVLDLCRNPLHSIPAMEEQVARLRESQDVHRLAHALCNLGQARFFRGDASGARSCYAEVLSLPPAGIDADAADDALFGLARVALLRGDYDSVEPALRKVLGQAERVGDDDGRSAALTLLGELARARGDTRLARALLNDALELALDGGMPLSIGRCEIFLAGVEFADGALDAARDLYAAALARAEGAAPFPYHEVRCILGMADVAAAAGDGAEVAGHYADARKRALASGDNQGLARIHAGNADLARSDGDLERALRLRHEALEMEEEIGDLPAVIRSLEAVAVLATLSDARDKAARLYGAAASLRERHGIARPMPEQRRYEADVELARQALDAETWDLTWEQGAGLSVAEAISYARKGRGSRLRPASGSDSITPAERDVVNLVIQGLTNPEVGARLFISRRTVQHHLGHVYAKLGISSRKALTQAAAEWEPEES